MLANSRACCGDVLRFKGAQTIFNMLDTFTLECVKPAATFL